jgi:hypothetical protein
MAAHGKIFVSYRRDDAPGDARSIYERLGRSFGEGNVFMDVDQLLAGQRFDRELDKALAERDVLIAVIEARWMDLLSEYAQHGKARLRPRRDCGGFAARHNRHPGHDGPGSEYAASAAGRGASGEYPRSSAVPETQHCTREVRP